MLAHTPMPPVPLHWNVTSIIAAEGAPKGPRAARGACASQERLQPACGHAPYAALPIAYHSSRWC